ncbi:hypothetical protein LQW54_001081 [Pestalotiopsis sp. IQ-011]
MSGIKRQNSSDAIGGDERDSKLSKPESESNDVPAAEGAAPDATDQQLRIEIKLGSALKAARNDPKPPLSMEDILRDLRGMDGDGAGVSSGPASPTTEHKHDSPRDPALVPQEFGRGHDEDQEANQDDDYDEDDEGDYETEHLWLETIRGTAAPSSKDSKIGSCVARLIRRGQMRMSFWSEMEEPSEETSDLAFELFDRYGRLQSDYYQHDILKGTGVWGKELNRGDLLLFEEIQVDQKRRRQGVASQIVKAILEKTREKVAPSVGFFALVKPGVLTSEAQGSQVPLEQHQAIAQSFWKSLGFRRVGTSSWLAFTDSVEHPSRQLRSGQDQEPQERSGDDVISPILEELYQKLDDPEIDEKDCISNVRAALSNGLENQKCGLDDNALLHITSLCHQSELVQFILAAAPQAATLRNRKGYTAAEALQRDLDDQRTRRQFMMMTVVVSDDFTGYPASAIASIAAFQQFSAFDLSTLSPQDIEAAVAVKDEHIRRPGGFDISAIRKTLQLKYGCTCGDCLGGFISPRMKFALLCAAEIRYDMMGREIQLCTGPEWVSWNVHQFRHLSFNVQNNLKTNKSMRQGFVNIYNHFAECLRRDRIPSEREVFSVLSTNQSEWPPATRTFLERGGSIASVANMIFETALDEDEWSGDGECRETFAEEIDKLPSCRNDHEFGFVSATCGYKKVRYDSSRFIM